VPYASGVTRTACSTATYSKPGMERTTPFPRDPKGSSFFAAPALRSVSNGRGTGVAPATSTTPSTFALAATKPRTELKNVLDRRKSEALTPYHPEVWCAFLQKQEYMKNMLTSFMVFAWFRHRFPLHILHSSPSQSRSVVEFKEEFARIVEHEIVKGRYIGPISQQDLEALVGPFQSSPFSIIPKPGKIGRYRNIQNYSFPLSISSSFPNPSINSLVDSDSFPTTWGTFSLVSLLIHRLPPGSQLATRDVAEAYRTSHYTTRNGRQLSFDSTNSSFAIDTSVCFGSGPSAGTYGEVRNAASSILRFPRHRTHIELGGRPPIFSHQTFLPSRIQRAAQGLEHGHR
jgi:hypothetical protein